jgi:hypothetical protein
MVGHAKYFLHQNKAAAPCPLGFGMINGDFCAIRHCHANHFAHCALSIAILNLFQENALTRFVLSKQVQDNDWVETSNNRHLASQQNPC